MDLADECDDDIVEIVPTTAGSMIETHHAVIRLQTTGSEVEV